MIKIIHHVKLYFHVVGLKAPKKVCKKNFKNIRINKHFEANVQPYESINTNCYILILNCNKKEE